MKQTIAQFKKTLLERDLIILLILLVVSIVAVVLVGHTPNTTNGTFCVPSGAPYGSDTLKVYAPKTGTYFVWLHLETTEQLSSDQAPTASGSYNPLLVGVDNQNCFAVGNDTNLPLNSWVWINSISTNPLIPFKVTLSRGIHIISISGVSESFDKLEIIPSSCVPTGDGTNCFSQQGTPNL